MSNGIDVTPQNNQSQSVDSNVIFVAAMRDTEFEPDFSLKNLRDFTWAIKSPGSADNQICQWMIMLVWEGIRAALSVKVTPLQLGTMTVPMFGAR